MARAFQRHHTLCIAVRLGSCISAALECNGSVALAKGAGHGRADSGDCMGYEHTGILCGWRPPFRHIGCGGWSNSCVSLLLGILAEHLVRAPAKMVEGQA